MEHSNDEDINATDKFGQTILDDAIYASKPSAYVEKILRAGISSGKNDGELYGLLLERVTRYHDAQVKEYGEESIKRSLQNVAVLLKHDVPFYDNREKDDFFKKLFSEKKLTEKYPDIMSEIKSYNNNDQPQFKMDILHAKQAKEGEEK